MRLDDPSVSRVHVVLEHTGDGWLAVDQVSKNGTRLDGRPIDRAVLPGRAWLEVGGIPLLIHSGGTSADEPGRSNARAGVEPGADPSGSDALDRALGELARISGCERAGLWLVEEAGSLQPLTQLGEFDPAPSMTVIGRTAASGKSEFCSDTDGARALAGSESISKGGIRAFFAMPVLRDDKVVGVAYADSLAPGRIFTQHDADLLEAVVRQLALILETGRVRTMIRSIRQGL